VLGLNPGVAACAAGPNPVCDVSLAIAAIAAVAGLTAVAATDDEDTPPSNVIPLPTPTVTNPEQAKSCYTGPGSCVARQKVLAFKRATVIGLLKNPLQYFASARIFNIEARIHNQLCPKNQVWLLPLDAGQPK